MKTIQNKICDEAELNVGMPMIFTLSEILKEWLVENNEEAGVSFILKPACIRM